MRMFALGALAALALATAPAAQAATTVTLGYEGTVSGQNQGSTFNDATTFIGVTTLEDIEDDLSFSFSSFEILFNGTLYTLANASASVGAGGLDLFTDGTLVTTFAIAGAPSFDGVSISAPVSLLEGDVFTATPDIGGVLITGGAGVATLAVAVPEPGTWAMLLIGFGALGAAMRRRNAVRVGFRFA